MTLDLHDNKLAIIYCRVSSPGQTGLGSQEHRCRQYAEGKGYTVVKVFYDDVPGKGDFMKRKGIVDLLKYMDAEPGTSFIVIFDDLKRYARETEFHLRLRRIMKERGIIRECLNYNFEDTPEGEFNETINAAVSTLERQQMARQNKQKSIARLEQGYAVFNSVPIGYKYVKVKGGNSEVVRNEPLASIVQEALEGFATGRFASQVEVKRFLESQPEFPKHFADGTIRQQKVVDMLKQHMYAGYIDAPKWGVSIRDAKHEGLVSKATFEVIKQRLAGTRIAAARADNHEDFPLRGAVACSCCKKTLRSGWSTGRSKKHPYYLCHTKGCDMYGKSIRRADIEGRFEDLLASLQPNESLFNVAMAMFHDYWNQMQEKMVARTHTAKKEIKKTETQIEQLIARIIESSNDRVVAAYEKRIDDLERKKLVLAENAAKMALPRANPNEMIEPSLAFLSNPHKIWASGRFELKRMVLKLTFSEPLLYCRETGYRTPKTTLPFKVLGDFCTSKCRMVPPARIEPSLHAHAL